MNTNLGAWEYKWEKAQNLDRKSKQILYKTKSWNKKAKQNPWKTKV